MLQMCNKFNYISSFMILNMYIVFPYDFVISFRHTAMKIGVTLSYQNDCLTSFQDTHKVKID